MRQRNVVGWETATDPGGEGFVTRISSNIRPQDPEGGAAWLAAPPNLVKMDVMNSQSVCCGASVGSFTDIGGVGRGGQGWGRSKGVAPTCGSGSTVFG